MTTVSPKPRGSSTALWPELERLARQRPSPPGLVRPRQHLLLVITGLALLGWWRRMWPWALRWAGAWAWPSTAHGFSCR